MTRRRLMIVSLFGSAILLMGIIAVRDAPPLPVFTPDPLVQMTDDYLSLQDKYYEALRERDECRQKPVNYSCANSECTNQVPVGVVNFKVKSFFQADLEDALRCSIVRNDSCFAGPNCFAPMYEFSDCQGFVSFDDTNDIPTSASTGNPCINERPKPPRNNCQGGICRGWGYPMM